MPENEKTFIEQEEVPSSFMSAYWMELTDLMQEGLPSRKSPLWAFIPKP